MIAGLLMEVSKKDRAALFAGRAHPDRRRQSTCFFVRPGNRLPGLADRIARLPFKEGILTLSRP